MVQAMISITEEANQILNIVKAKHNLNDKSQAIDFVVKEYGKDLLEPPLRPEFKAKLTKIIQGRHLSRREFEREVN
jgi:uncharacterized protein (DUF2267 family)